MSHLHSGASQKIGTHFFAFRGGLCEDEVNNIKLEEKVKKKELTRKALQKVLNEVRIEDRKKQKRWFEKVRLEMEVLRTRITI